MGERVLIVTHHRRKVLTEKVSKPKTGVADVQLMKALASDDINKASRSVIVPSL